MSWRTGNAIFAAMFFIMGMISLFLGIRFYEPLPSILMLIESVVMFWVFTIAAKDAINGSPRQR